MFPNVPRSFASACALAVVASCADGGGDGTGVGSEAWSESGSGTSEGGSTGSSGGSGSEAGSGSSAGTTASTTSGGEAGSSTAEEGGTSGGEGTESSGGETGETGGVEGDCVKLTVRDDAYAFKVRIRDTSGYFKVNVGTGPTHGDCPTYRVNHIGNRVIAGDASAYENMRTEACFILASGSDGGPVFEAEWDVVVPFVPDTGLEFTVAPGPSGEVEVSILGFDDTPFSSQTFDANGSMMVTRDQLPPPGGLALSLPAKPALPAKMGAYYFPWYGTPDGPTGNWVHWNPDEPELYMPQLGMYDSGDPAVIAQHMQWARQANFNLMVLSYWDQEHSNENTAPILEGAADADIEISAMIETATRRDGTPRENFLAQLQEILDQYADHPAWLRAGDVPIVFVYSRLRGELPGGFADWQWVKDQLDGEMIVMYPITGDTTPAEIEAMGGGFVFAANSGGASTWTGAHEEDWNWTWKTYEAGGLSALPILPSFMTVRTAEDEVNYKNQWRAARNAMPDMILVNSWNEYHESSIIEPTEEFGLQYIENSAVEAEMFCEGELGEIQ